MKGFILGLVWFILTAFFGNSLVSELENFGLFNTPAKQQAFLDWVEKINLSFTGKDTLPESSTLSKLSYRCIELVEEHLAEDTETALTYSVAARVFLARKIELLLQANLDEEFNNELKENQIQNNEALRSLGEVLEELRNPFDKEEEEDEEVRFGFDAPRVFHVFGVPAAI